MKKILTLLSISSFLFFAACGTPMTVMRPAIAEEFVDKQGFTTQRADDIAVTFGYLFETRDHFVFDVAVENNTGDSLIVNPTDFYYRAQNPADTTRWTSPKYALSNLQVLTKLDENYKRTRRKVTAAWIASIVLVVAAVVADDHNNNDFSNIAPAINTAVDLSFIWSGAQATNKFSHADAQRYVQETAFEKTTIGHGKKYDGTVYFPKSTTAKRFLFNFSIDRIPIETPFVVKKIR